MSEAPANKRRGDQKGASNNGYKHGMSNTPTYRSWVAMKVRCLYEKHPHYDRYGGRGITICPEWMNSFEAFFTSMGERPAGATLGRIDSNLGYFASNCRWETHTEQNRNTSANRLITYDGETMCVASWAERFGLRYSVLRNRLNRGWDIERALYAPRREYPDEPLLFDFDGRKQSLDAWAKECGISASTLRGRLHKGWSFADAIQTPVGTLTRWSSPRKGNSPTRAERRARGWGGSECKGERPIDALKRLATKEQSSSLSADLSKYDLVKQEASS